MNKNALKLAKSIFPEENIREIKNLSSRYFKRLKITVFVPEEFADRLTFAMASAGAGIIGKYSVCSFRAKGTGTFKGGKGTNPAVGVKGKFEKVNEVRLEMVCDAKNLDIAIDSMLEVHPYEEPAYDIYEVYSRAKSSECDLVEILLKKPVHHAEVLEKLNRKLSPDTMKGLPLKGKFSRAVINFTGYRIYPVQEESKKIKSIYITLNENDDINIRSN